jgi:hypothetical protein
MLVRKPSVTEMVYIREAAAGVGSTPTARQTRGLAAASDGSEPGVPRPVSRLTRTVNYGVGGLGDRVDRW